MEIRVGEVDNAFAFLVLDVRVGDVPLFWDGPVEYVCSARNLANLKVQFGSDQPQRLSDSMPRNAPANRIETTDSLVQLRTCHLGRRLPKWRQVALPL